MYLLKNKIIFFFRNFNVPPRKLLNLKKDKAQNKQCPPLPSPPRRPPRPPRRPRRPRRPPRQHGHPTLIQHH